MDPKPPETNTAPNEFQEAKAIADKQIATFLDEPVQKTEPKAETTPVAETPAQPTTPTTPETPSTPSFDPQKLEDNITQRVTDSIVKAFTGGKDEGQIVEESPWAKEKRNPKSYEEIVDWTKAQVMKEFQAQQTEYQKQEETRKQEEAVQLEQRKQYEAKLEKDYNTSWDEQITELQKKGTVPKTKDGIRNFWEQVYQHNEGKMKQGLPIVDNLAAFAALYYQPYSPKAPGSDAPISGGNTNIPTAAGDDDYDYHTIHNAKSFHDLLPKSK